MVHGTEPLPTPEIRISLGSMGIEDSREPRGAVIGESDGVAAVAVVLVKGAIAGGSIGPAAAANIRPLPIMTSNNAASLPNRVTILIPGSGLVHSSH